MHGTKALAILVGLLLAVGASAVEVAPEVNPAIDMDAFLTISRQAAVHRESRRVSEREFLRMASEPGTVILDARSRERFDDLHVRGAVHLTFADLAVASLARLIPDKSTRILIYCNNNFAGAEQPFPSKLPPASLNLSTYVALYTYGYRNVYELAPLVELQRSILPFEGRLAYRERTRPPSSSTSGG
jgi:hypothetical protein